MRFGDLLDRWESRARVLEECGAKAQADFQRKLASEVQESDRAWWLEELSIAEAATESGYSEDHLRDLVRDGTLPSSPNGRISVRRADLPRKPGRSLSRAGEGEDRVQGFIDRLST